MRGDEMRGDERRREEKRGEERRGEERRPFSFPEASILAMYFGIEAPVSMVG